MKNTATPDLNRDGRVTEADLHVLHDLIQSGNAPSHADLNGDGKVDGKDTPCIATLIGESKSQGKGASKGKAQEQKTDKTHGRHACLPAAMPQERLFVYDEWRLLGEYGLDGSAAQETVWLGDLPIATVQNGEIYYVHTDHLGTPRVITAPGTGTEVWRWDSEPFGSSAANEDPDGDGVSFAYNLRFPGQYYDAETRLSYNYFRTYDPRTGRYVQADPMGQFGGSLSLYSYVAGDPISYCDALGLYSMSDIFRAWNHYCDGSGTDWSTGFSSLNWGDTESKISQQIRGIVGGNCRDAIIPVGIVTEGQTGGADRYIIGRHNVSTNGEVQLSCDCTWEFTGVMSSASGFDTYNFNKSNRGGIAETLTSMGRSSCKNKAKRFDIQIYGHQTLTLRGKLNGKSSCCGK